MELPKALRLLVQSGYVRDLEIFIERTAANINEPVDTGKTALYVAVLHGREEVVKFLLARGARVPTREAERAFATEKLLHVAAAGNSVTIVDLLIKAGVPVDSKDRGLITALHVAVCYGRIEIVRSLIAAGVDVNAMDVIASSAPLHWAACYGHYEIVELLIEAGALVTVRGPTRFGLTPLDVAVRHQQTSVADFLKQRPEYSWEEELTGGALHCCQLQDLTGDPAKKFLWWGCGDRGMEHD